MWEQRENLANAKDLVERFEEEYREESRWARKEDHREFHIRITREVYSKDTV